MLLFTPDSSHFFLVITSGLLDIIESQQNLSHTSLPCSYDVMASAMGGLLGITGNLVVLWGNLCSMREFSSLMENYAMIY